MSAHFIARSSLIGPIVHLNPGSIGLNPSRFTCPPEAARLQTIIGFATSILRSNDCKSGRSQGSNVGYHYPPPGISAITGKAPRTPPVLQGSRRLYRRSAPHPARFRLQRLPPRTSDHSRLPLVQSSLSGGRRRLQERQDSSIGEQLFDGGYKALMALLDVTGTEEQRFAGMKHGIVCLDDGPLKVGFEKRFLCRVEISLCFSELPLDRRPVRGPFDHTSTAQTILEFV